jgi:selenide,water dikinase
MIEAECTVIGGHSIRDEETKFGYSVTGLIHPKNILANAGALPGDALILTKALGTGVISTAIKKGMAEKPSIDAAIQSMTTLNRRATEVILQGEFRVRAMTDITGFGLIGHAREMALASNVALRFFSRDIPVLPGALECIRAGHIPGGLKNNRDFAECTVSYEAPIAPELKTLLFDPQTAGGLFISIAEDDRDKLLRDLREAGVPAHCIGNVTEYEVTEPREPLIRVD